MGRDIKLLGSSNNQFYGDLNDISYDSNGNIRMLTGTERARQSIVKILLTSRNNIPFPDYGTDLPNITGAGLAADATKELIASTILFALTFYNTSLQDPIPSETIQQVVDIQIRFEDPSSYEVYLSLLMGDGTALNIPLGS